MSRVAKSPIALPKGVQVSVSGGCVTVKGAKGSLELAVDACLSVSIDGEVVTVSPVVPSVDSWMKAGTARANLNNLVKGFLLASRRNSSWLVLVIALRPKGGR